LIGKKERIHFSSAIDHDGNNEDTIYEDLTSKVILDIAGIFIQQTGVNIDKNLHQLWP